MQNPTPPSREMALNAQIVDFTSKINGRDYRLMISVPTRRPVPAAGHPVLYLIDGNLHFGIAVDTARIQACWPDVVDPVVVGIGYPTDSVTVALQVRMKDLTTPITQQRLDQGWLAAMQTRADDCGGMDDYLRVIDDEIKQRVAQVAPVDPDDQTLMGHSLGGLTTLHALLRRTASFQQFVAISPSIWWNDGAVLAHEAPFAQRVRAHSVQARALLSVGELEGGIRAVPERLRAQLPGSEEGFREMAAECRMVLNTSELGQRLAALQGDRFTVQTVVHAGDDHNMVPGAGIARGVQFAMRRP